jgi:hypothetical protein
VCAVLYRGYGKLEIGVDFKMMFEKKLSESHRAKVAGVVGAHSGSFCAGN